MGGKVINTYFIYEHFAKIEIVNSKKQKHEVIIDLEMVDRIKHSGASIRLKVNVPYCYFKEKNPVILAHYILDVNKSTIVKYNNGNTLDLRVKNITKKITTFSENSELGIPGVYPYKPTSQWGASIDHKNKTHFLGYFDSEIQAASAVAMKRLQLYEENKKQKNRSIRQPVHHSYLH